MRTQISRVSKSHSIGKWNVTFQTYSGIVGDEYLVCELTSASVFDSEDDAYAGGIRALDILEKEDKFPNMCKYF